MARNSEHGARRQRTQTVHTPGRAELASPRPRVNRRRDDEAPGADRVVVNLQPAAAMWAFGRPFERRREGAAIVAAATVPGRSAPALSAAAIAKGGGRAFAGLQSTQRLRSWWEVREEEVRPRRRRRRRNAKCGARVSRGAGRGRRLPPLGGGRGGDACLASARVWSLRPSLRRATARARQRGMSSSSAIQIFHRSLRSLSRRSSLSECLISLWTSAAPTAAAERRRRLAERDVEGSRASGRRARRRWSARCWSVGSAGGGRRLRRRHLRRRGQEDLRPRRHRPRRREAPPRARCSGSWGRPSSDRSVAATVFIRRARRGGGGPSDGGGGGGRRLAAAYRIGGAWFLWPGIEFCRLVV